MRKSRTASGPPLRAGMCVLLAFALALPGLGQAPLTDVADDPLPIRRVQVPASRLSAELERARAGVLVPLARAEFEKRVRLAAKDRKEQPRLLKASYRATMGESALIGGRGEWTVQYQGAVPAVLPLPDFNLALSQLRDANNKDAILADLGGKSLGLFIDRTGGDKSASQKFYFDWTLRGVPSVAGQAFAMQVPTCAAASLELRLPADQLLLVSPKTAMLSGPHESESAKHRIWRLHFTGRSQVEFAVKKQSGPEGKPVVLASVQCRQQLLPGRCQADFEYQAEVLHGHVDQLSFACDPNLEPYEVTLKSAELKGWEIREPDKGKRLLIVSLREPLQGALSGLVVRCFAPLKADQRWISPGLHMQQAHTRGEIIQLSLHPEVQLQGWQPGQFQLLRSSVNPGGTQTLVLGRSGAGQDQTDRSTRPAGTARYGGVEFLAKQKSWWHIGPRAATLTAEIAYEIHRGSLFQLALVLPKPYADWTVEAVQLNPGKKAPTWMLAGSNLLINLDAPLTAADDARLRLRLRSQRRGPIPASGVTLPFADLAPADPCLHAGELGVSIDPSLDARVLDTPLASGPVDVHGPWGKNALDFLFAHRQQPVAGRLHVQARRSRLDAQVFTEVALSGPQAAWRTRLTLGPQASSPAGIDLAISGSGLHRLRMQSGTKAVHGVTRQPIAEALPALLALGCRGGIDQALLALSLPRGQRWRIDLAEPLEQRAEINLEAQLEPATVGNYAQTWEVPLVTVLDAERHEMQVAIQALNAATLRQGSAGLKLDASLPGGGQGGLTMDGDGSPFPRLTLQTQPQTGIAPGAAESCERAVLLSEWQADGSLVHHFRFELLNWSKPSMPMVLPAGTRQVLGVRADGRWLDSFPRQVTPEGLRVELPVPADRIRHAFEIVYVGPDARVEWSIGDWLVCGALPSPLPKLPLPMSGAQRRWRLPADLVPLRGSAFRAVDSPQGGHVGRPGLAQMRRLWHVGDSLVASLGMHAGMEGKSIQQLLAADVALRNRSTKPRQLGDLLQELAQQLENSTLVLDASALEADGLRANSLIAPATKATIRAPLWEQAGLVIVPSRPTPLVTTRGRLDAHAERATPQRIAESLAKPIQEALLHGQDGSGRFQTLASWLRESSPALDDSVGLDNRAFSQSHLPGWTDWEPVLGHPQADVTEELTVVRSSFLTTCGIGLALAMFFAARSIRKRVSGGWRFRLWLAWVSGALLGCIWLPSPFGILSGWMVLSAALAALVVWLGMLSRGHPSAAGSAARGSATLAVVLIVGCWLGLHDAARSGGDEPFTVLMLPGKNGAAGQEVLVPHELLKRLDRLAEGVQPFRDAVILTGARYRGTAHGSAVDFKVDFACFSLADKGQLFVPLDGVDLQPGAFLDGAPVYPVVAPAPRSGYLVPVQGKGAHQLTLSFTARVTQTGVNQQLRFQIPRLAQNQLVELLLPASAQGAQAIGALGSQALAKSGNDWSLKAQIGPQQLMDVHWRSATGKPGPAARVEVRELYYWDLRLLPSPSLTGILKYAIAKGQVSALAVSMPDELEVQSVEVAAGPMSESTPRMKSWTVRKGPSGKDKRTLAIEFLTPVAGEVHVKLAMAPRIAVRPGNAALPLPYPLQIKPAGFQEGFLAYRVAGLEARESPKDLGIIGIEPAAFVKEWRQADPRADVQPTRAVNFRRNSPKASLGLSLLGPAVSASQEITWDVQPFHADVTAVCELNAPAGDLMLLEWHVPAAVVLADVYGPHVHGWSRQESLVQVWLTQPQKETRVTLWGWLRHAAPLLPGKVAVMALPHVSLRQPAPTATVVRLQPERGLKLAPVQVEGLRPLRSDESGALLYAPAGPPAANYAGSFRLAPAPAAPAYRSVTVLQAHGERLTLAAEISVQAAPGTVSLQVQARGWPDDVQLDVPDSLPPPQRHKTDAGVSWTVQMHPGLPERMALRLHAETTMSRKDDLAMPDVRIVGARAQERWLGVVGPDWTGATAANVKPATDFASSLASWPERAKQLQGDGSLWQVLADDWRLTVKARTAFADPPVQVVSCEHESALAPDGRWVHEARFELFTRAGGDVRVLLPGSSGLTGLQLDGVPIQPARAGNEGKHWRVALPRATGPHVLRVRWQHAIGEETIDAPSLATPTLAGIGPVKVAGVVWLPAELRESSMVHGQRLSAAQWMLARARAQAQLCALLVRHRKDLDAGAWEPAMRRAQERLYWCCRQAEHLASRASDMGVGNDSGVTEAVRQLQEDNAKLAEKKQYAKLQKSAAKAANLREPIPIETSLHAVGIARYWQGEADVPPVLQLVAHAAEGNRGRLYVTQGVIMAFIGLLILSLLPVVARLARALWPEQLLLLAAAGWLAFGPSLVGVLLATIAVTGRLILLFIWGRRWHSRRTDVGGSSSFHPTGA